MRQECDIKVMPDSATMHCNTHDTYGFNGYQLKIRCEAKEKKILYRLEKLVRGSK